MKLPDLWMPSKFERDARGRWRASRAEVPIASRLMVDLGAAAYSLAVAQHASGRLADLGCGKVPLFGMYRERVTEVVCVDWAESLHGSAHIDIFANLNEPIDLAPDSFDTVIATDVIEHLHTPQALFASAARALRPGGKFIVGVPFLYWIHEQPNDFHRYTRFALERLAHDAGLIVASLATFGGAPEVVSDLMTKSVASHPVAARTVYAITRAALSLSIVKKFSAATAKIMPMGYVLVAQRR